MSDSSEPDGTTNLTIGAIRELIKDLPDDACLFPVWAYGPPGDDEPAVSICGLQVEADEITKQPGLAVLVDLKYLNDDHLNDDDDGWGGLTEEDD
jgi:hypothetical protein